MQTTNQTTTTVVIEGRTFKKKGNALVAVVTEQSTNLQKHGEVARYMPNESEIKIDSQIAKQVGFKDKMPSKVNSMNASSIAGYMLRYRNWKNKLYVAAREINLFKNGKKQRAAAMIASGNQVIFNHA